MPRSPRITAKRLISLLLKHGFEVVRVKGSHHYVQHPDGRATAIPVHSGEVIGAGLFADVLNDVEMIAEELLNPSRRT